MCISMLPIVMQLFVFLIMESDDAFPKSKLRLAPVWIDLHANEIMDNWALISSDKKFFKIAPLEVR